MGPRFFSHQLYFGSLVGTVWQNSFHRRPKLPIKPPEFYRLSPTTAITVCPSRDVDKKGSHQLLLTPSFIDDYVILLAFRYMILNLFCCRWFELLILELRYEFLFKFCLRYDIFYKVWINYCYFCLFCMLPCTSMESIL